MAVALRSDPVKVTPVRKKQIKIEMVESGQTLLNSKPKDKSIGEDS